MIEPEEVVEARLVARLSAALPSLDIIGALSPFGAGDVKQSSDTYVSVFCDVSSQDGDWIGRGMPRSYSARVTVHFSDADDANGAGFRDACRAVRGSLDPMLGDGCTALSGDGFRCDAFAIDSTETSIDPDATSGGMAKTYQLTIKGRFAAKE